MLVLTDVEVEFLRSHWLGRLATASTAARPHVVPVAYDFDTGRGTIRIGAHPLEGRGQERLYVRQARANPFGALVVDDVPRSPQFTPRGLIVKGALHCHATGGEELGEGLGPQRIELTPDWVSSWGIETGSFDPATPRRHQQ